MSQKTCIESCITCAFNVSFSFVQRVQRTKRWMASNEYSKCLLVYPRQLALERAPLGLPAGWARVSKIQNCVYKRTDCPKPICCTIILESNFIMTPCSTGANTRDWRRAETNSGEIFAITSQSHGRFGEGCRLARRLDFWQLATTPFAGRVFVSRLNLIKTMFLLHLGCHFWTTLNLQDVCGLPSVGVRDLSLPATASQSFKCQLFFGNPDLFLSLVSWPSFFFKLSAPKVTGAERSFLFAGP